MGFQIGLCLAKVSPDFQIGREDKRQANKVQPEDTDSDPG
jgi:hypothetical protein